MDQMIKRLRSFNLSRKFIFTIIYRCIKELSAHSLRIEVSLRDLRKAQRKFEWSGKRSIRETKNNSRRLHGRLISDHPRWNLPASFSVIKGSFPPKKAVNVAVSIDRRNRFERSEISRIRRAIWRIGGPPVLTERTVSTVVRAKDRWGIFIEENLSPRPFRFWAQMLAAMLCAAWSERRWQSYTITEHGDTVKNWSISA